MTDLEDDYPDTLEADSVHFAGDAQAFLYYWLERLGYSDFDGAALLVSADLALSILTPGGEILSVSEIANRARKSGLRPVK